METIWLVVAGVLGLAVVSFVAYLIISTARSRPKGGGRHRAPSKKRPHRDTFRTEEPDPEPKKRAAVIVQDGHDALRTELTSQSVARDWDEPLWLVVDDVATAAAAARQSLEAAVDVVCVRGDSAIDRGVASVLAGTETPLAFLPGGGSLLGVGGTPVAADAPGVGAVEPGAPRSPSAHTRATWPADDPVSDQALAEAMTTALTGQNTRVHVGRAVLALAEPVVAAVPGAGAAPDRTANQAPDQTPGQTDQAPTNQAPDQADQAPTNQAPTETVFLYSLVLGDIVPRGEPPLTTKKVAKDLFQGTSFTATVKPDDEEEVTRPARSLTFEIGADQPDADASVSQALDAYLYASQSFKGWTGVARAMMRKASRATPLLVPMRSIAFSVTLDKPAELTIDGQVVGTVQPGESTISLDRHSLVVRR